MSCAQTTAVPSDACESVRNKAELRGRIVLVQRGGCDFVQKIGRLQAAGAKAVIVMDSEARDLNANW